MFGTLGAVTLLSHIYSLNNIKSRTVGDGQHGTARWATNAQITALKKIPVTKGELCTFGDGWYLS